MSTRLSHTLPVRPTLFLSLGGLALLAGCVVPPQDHGGEEALEEAEGNEETPGALVDAWLDDGGLAALDDTGDEESPIDDDDDSSQPASDLPVILWRDSLQDGDEPWGFDSLEVQHPIGTTVPPDDANGANLSLAPDPADEGGVALRHFGTFEDGGSRAQAGLWSFANPAFDQQAKSPEGIWVAQEWYFPEALSADGDEWAWLNLWDWHSTGPDDRWHTSPGLFLAQDGSMHVRWSWGPNWDTIPRSDWSSQPLPVGEWFDIEMHYVWSEEPTTISLWINGELAIEQSGVITKDAGHDEVETYSKFYGSDQGRTPWSPSPSVRYTRNARFAGERIGR